MRNRALRTLSRREHSRAELTRALAPYASAEEISGLLDNLQQTDLLSDARFAASFVRTRLGRYGAFRLRHDLRARGVADDLAEAAINAVLLEEQVDEPARALAIWQRKFGVTPRDAREYAKQARFLQSRGFSSDIVRKVLKAAGKDSSA